jgi:hypothetical protein
MQRGLYAYAITRAGAPLDLHGVAGITGAQPRLVTHRQLALVVSDVELAALQGLSDEDLSETGRLAGLARQHDAVVRAIFERAPVLPLRFGTVVTDSASSVRLLEERHDVAQTRLDEFTDHQEWGVRLFDTGDRETSSSRTSTSTGARMSGTAYLAQRRSELAAAEQRREFAASAASAVRTTLDGYASNCVARTGHTQPDLLLDTAYLVPVAAEPAFLAQVDQLAQEMAVDGLRLELTGPWPPYSFAQLDVEEVPRD